MDWIEYAKAFITHPGFVLISAVTLFEISPIKINPWKWLFKWVGRAINGDIREDLTEFKRDFEETKAQDKRWHILSFVNSCRRGQQHSKDEWQHVMSELKDYEAYTERKHIANGVIDEDAKYLRELYHERNIKNDFL